MIKTFLINIYLHGPNLSGQVTHISIVAGNAKPKADRQKAPNNDMNKPSNGIDTAKTTGTKETFVIDLTKESN